MYERRRQNTLSRRIIKTIIQKIYFSQENIISFWKYSSNDDTCLNYI